MINCVGFCVGLSGSPRTPSGEIPLRVGMEHIFTVLCLPRIDSGLCGQVKIASL